LFEDAIFSSYCQIFVEFLLKIRFLKKNTFWKIGIFLKIKISVKILRYYDITIIIKLCYNDTCLFFLTIIYIQENWNWLKLQYIQINYKNSFWREIFNITFVVVIKWHDIKFFSIFNKLMLQQCYFIRTHYLYTSNDNINSWKCRYCIRWCTLWVHPKMNSHCIGMLIPNILDKMQ